VLYVACISLLETQEHETRSYVHDDGPWPPRGCGPWPPRGGGPWPPHDGGPLPPHGSGP